MKKYIGHPERRVDSAPSSRSRLAQVGEILLVHPSRVSESPGEGLSSARCDPCAPRIGLARMQQLDEISCCGRVRRRTRNSVGWLDLGPRGGLRAIATEQGALRRDVVMNRILTLLKVINLPVLRSLLIARQVEAFVSPLRNVVSNSRSYRIFRRATRTHAVVRSSLIECWSLQHNCQYSSTLTSL